MRGSFRNVAVIVVSQAGLRTALRLITGGFNADLYVPENMVVRCAAPIAIKPFCNGIHALVEKIFTGYDGLVFVMPMGIVVRAVALHIKSKHADPAVVTVDVGGRWAIATLAGHEGGANELAALTARFLHAEPVITTSAEAIKTLIVGIGCRKGVSADDVDAAVGSALHGAGCSFDEIRLVATVDAKQNEAGLLAFCANHALTLKVISREEIREARIRCEESEFVRKTLGIGAVAVPCALLGGSKTKLLTDRISCCRVTVALARENCAW